MRRDTLAEDMLVIEYGYLAEGQSLTGQPCPSCDGGQSGDKDLSVSMKDGALLFFCHRASCQFQGRIPMRGVIGGPVTKKQRPYPLIRSQLLDAATAKLLRAKYGVTSDALEFAGLRWTGDGDSIYSKRVAFPIYDPNHRERGLNYRSYVVNVSPKALVEMKSEEETKACWYKMKRKSPTLVVVEDQMSALKLAPHTHTLALLGTHISDAVLEEIVAGDYMAVYITLDPDATYEAIKLQLKFRNKIKGLLVATCPRDPKDLTEEELNAYVQDHLSKDALFPHISA